MLLLLSAGVDTLNTQTSATTVEVMRAKGGLQSGSAAVCEGRWVVLWGDLVTAF